MSQREIDRLPPEERLALAKERAPGVRDHIIEVLELVAANDIIAYSDALVRQVPPSRAANAFNQFQNAMLRYCIVRLTALWDGIDIQKKNIPTLAALLADERIIQAVANETIEAFTKAPTRMLNTHNDPELDRIAKEQARLSQLAFADAQAEKARVAIRSASTEIKEVYDGSLYASVANMRDKHLAHALVTTRRERVPVEPMKYGQERELLDVSVRLFSELTTWVSGYFMWDDSREIAKENAEALWLSCRFQFKH